MKERLAIIDGIRTPIGKAGGQFKNVSADDLGAHAVRELMARVSIDPNDIDEVVIGNVAQPSNAANISRVVALKGGLPEHVPGMTVHRNCASGMEAISTAASKIFSGDNDIILAGGTESMSNIPLLYGKQMTAFFDRLSRARSLGQKLGVLASFRPSFLKPRIGLLEGLTDPTCGLIMGLTAENLARDFKISRAEQDQYALDSHQKASKAQENGVFADEIVPFVAPPKYDTTIESDESIRPDQSLEQLAKLRPYFDKRNGTVTVGNACPINDGAAAMIVMAESKAKSLGLTPLGYVRDYAYAGLDPSRMGLGPVFASAKLFAKTGLSLSDMQLIEINEAFAAQVLACIAAFESDTFAKEKLGLDQAMGTFNQDILNVNGGAIALGHPVGTTGTRIVLTLLKELKRRGLERGLATLCVGGGQGGAFIVETA